MKSRKVKKNIIILIAILVLLCTWGIHSIHDNYRLGQDLYSVLNPLSRQYADLAESIDRLKGAVDRGEDSYGFLNAYYNAHFKFWSFLGYDDVPFLDDVRTEWAEVFDKHRQENYRGDEHVRSIFADEEKFKELAHLRDQLNHVVDCFQEFRENYEQMSNWDRYFTSWKDEQKILNEKVRFTPLSE